MKSTIHQLFDSSFSRQLISHFNKAANDADNDSAEVQQAIRELQQLSDAELWDLGISRSEIPHAVRYGRPGSENTNSELDGAGNRAA